MTDLTIPDIIKATEEAKRFLRKADRAEDGDERKGYLTIAKAKLNGVMRWLVRETGE